jgi:hypothetical protein
MHQGMFMKLSRALQASDTSLLKKMLKEELQGIDPALLPLQQGLSHSSYVSARPFSITILNITHSGETIRVKAGVFYTGIIAGCSCADDPTPQDEQNEYCELQFDINRVSGDATVMLLPD